MDRLIQAIVVAAIVIMAMRFLPSFDETPQPKPGPVDPVDPKPSPNEPTFAGYDVKVYDRIMQVKSRTRADDCKQLAGDVQSIIDRIDAGTIATNKGVVDALVVAFRKLPMAWYPQIRKIADDVLQPLTKDGSLSTTKRWGKLLTVVKPGIDRAGKESTGIEAEDKPGDS